MKNSSVQKFNNLHNGTWSRAYLKKIITLAEKEKEVNVLRRLNALLDSNPDAVEFQLEVDTPVKPYAMPKLAAPRHTGVAKEALSDCGRLKPGYKYEKGGTIVKVEKKEKKKKLANSSKKQLIIAHLKAMSKSKFANDYAYMFSADLDKVVWRIEDDKTYAQYIELSAEKVLKEPRHEDTIGFNKNTEAKKVLKDTYKEKERRYFIKEIKSKIRKIIKAIKIEKTNRIYNLGDGLTDDFDYNGLYNTGLKITLKTPVDTLQKLYFSFKEISEHEIADLLGYLQKNTDNTDSPEALGVPFLSFAEQRAMGKDESMGLGKAVSSNDIYQMITDQILKAIEDHGDLTWYSGRKTDGSKDSFVSLPMPINYNINKYYRGINAFMLSHYPARYKIVEKEGKKIKQIELEPITDHRLFWMTFSQIKKEKAKLKKGAIGMDAIFYNFVYKHEGKNISEKLYNELYAKFNCGTKASNAENCGKLSKNAFLRYYKVFNERDIEDVDFDLRRKKIEAKAKKFETQVEKIEAAESIIKNMPNAPKIIEKYIGKGKSPNYKPSSDIVEMPQKTQYDNVAIWYGTAFHELCHATGHESRLKREGIINFEGFGSPSYAFEELVAELGSAFLNAESGILFQTLKKNAAYIKGWKESVKSILKKDNKAIFKAAGQAQKAADYILDRDSKGKPKFYKDLKINANKVTDKKDRPTTEELRKKLIITSSLKTRVEFEKWLKKVGFTVIEKKATNEFFKDKKNTTYTLNYKNLGSLVLNVLGSHRKGQYEGMYKIKGLGIDAYEGLYDYDYPEAFYEHIASELEPILLLSVKDALELKQIHKNTLIQKKDKKQMALFGASKRKKKAKPEIIKKLGTVVVSVPVGETQPNVQNGAIEGLAPFAVLDTQESEPEPQISDPVEKTKKPVVKGLQNLRQLRKNAKEIKYFNLNGELSKFLGRIERKPIHSVVITLDAPPGSGKTRVLFQALDMCADAGLHSAFASLEEHPLSGLFQEKEALYIKPQNIDYITPIDDLPATYDEFLDTIKNFDVIAIDSWNKVFEKYKGIDFDNDLRKALDGKIIITIFQRTQSGQMRGGSRAAFDGDIILQVEAKPSFKDSYVVARKNRYQNIPLDEIGYNFYHKKVINPQLESEAQGIPENSSLMI